MAETKFKQTEIGLIPEDWNLIRLSNISKFQYGLGESAQKKGEYIYIRITDITSDGFLKKDNLVFIQKEKVKPETILNKGDILVARTGASFGKTYLFKEEFKASYGGFLIKFLLDDKKIDSNYFFQFTRGNCYWNQANNLATGGAQPQFNANTIAELKIPIPPLPEQKAIAKILSDLDFKIELLQQQNKTLENIGKTIFKHWFVNFEFPNEEGKPYKSSGGEMVESELGEIPKGWKINSLDNVADYLNGLALQKYPPRGNDDLPVIKIRELKQGITSSTDMANSDVPEKYILQNGDVIFSWSGSLVVDLWTFGKGALNQHLFKVTSDIYPKWFYYYWTKFHLEKFIRIASDKATTMGHIQRKHLSESMVLIPSELESLNKLFEPLVDKYVLNGVEIESLKKQRDLLLPKLMTGKIRVKEDML